MSDEVTQWTDGRGRTHVIRDMANTHLVNVLRQQERSAMNLHRLHGSEGQSWEDYVIDEYDALVAEAKRRELEW